MPSQKQIVANRQNAKKSTGPTSANGKAAVAMNALQHGLLSQHVCLPDEEEAALIALGKKPRDAIFQYANGSPDGARYEDYSPLLRDILSRGLRESRTKAKA